MGHTLFENSTTNVKVSSLSTSFAFAITTHHGHGLPSTFFLSKVLLGAYPRNFYCSLNRLHSRPYRLTNRRPLQQHHHTNRMESLCHHKSRNSTSQLLSRHAHALDRNHYATVIASLTQLAPPQSRSLSASTSLPGLCRATMANLTLRTKLLRVLCFSMQSLTSKHDHMGEVDNKCDFAIEANLYGFANLIN